MTINQCDSCRPISQGRVFSESEAQPMAKKHQSVARAFQPHPEVEAGVYHAWNWNLGAMTVISLIPQHLIYWISKIWTFWWAKMYDLTPNVLLLANNISEVEINKWQKAKVDELTHSRVRMDRHTHLVGSGPISLFANIKFGGSRLCPISNK